MGSAIRGWLLNLYTTATAFLAKYLSPFLIEQVGGLGCLLIAFVVCTLYVTLERALGTPALVTHAALFLTATAISAYWEWVEDPNPNGKLKDFLQRETIITIGALAFWILVR